MKHQGPFSFSSAPQFLSIINNIAVNSILRNKSLYSSLTISVCFEHNEIIYFLIYGTDSLFA